MTTRSPQAILFDLDGTLLDDNLATETAAVRLHGAYGGALGISLEALTVRWKKLIDVHYPRYLAGELTLQGQRRARVTDLFGEPLSDARADEVFAVYETAYREAWAPFADAAPMLTALRGYRMGVLTNGEIGQQTQKLRAAGLIEHFASVFASSELGVAKPHAEAFLKACAGLRVEPERCVYVGDNLETDARGSARAGLMSVWLDRHRAGRNSSGEFQVIHSLEELPARFPFTT